MSDAIEVRGLRALGTHGLLEEEIERPQPFEIDLDIKMPLEDAGRSGQLDKTADYRRVVDAVRTIVEGSRFALLESLAAAIADSVLKDERIDAVTVAVRKLRPPLAADVATVGVRITRPRVDAGTQL